MVKIVTGKINSFKTTRLLKHYELHGLGDGFIAVKHMNNNLVKAYDLVRLSDKLTIPYIIRDIYDTNEEEIVYQLGPYRFYKSTQDFVEKAIDDFIEKKTSPIYLDEISLLELNNQGYHKVLTKLLDMKIDLVLVIREDLLKKVIDKYQIKEYEII